MKKDTKTYLVLAVIIIAVIALIFWIKPNPETPGEKTAKCIGEKSFLYVQLGCSACRIQEEIFGENYAYLTTIDCAYDGKKCLDAGIKGTPTWVINNEKYPGVQSIEKLKELTGC